jgi:hypothetical protein
MNQRRKSNAAAAVAVLVLTVLGASCAPPSGLPTRQVKLDDFCTLEARVVQQGGSSYVAARKFGVDWVDGTITGGQSQGCRTWILTGIDATTTEGTNACTFWVPDGMPNSPGPGCTGFAPDWYQAAQPGDLIVATVHVCKTAMPPYGYDCTSNPFPGGIVVYP